MKRFVCFLLIVAVVLSFAACGSKRMDGISDRAYELGLTALETADDFIAGKIDADTAEGNLVRVNTLVDACEGENDSLISSTISLMQIAVTKKGNGTGTMADVQKYRDQLAGYLGK